MLSSELGGPIRARDADLAMQSNQLKRVKLRKQIGVGLALVARQFARSKNGTSS